MTRRTLLPLIVLGTVLAGPAAAAAGELPPATRWLPDDAVLTVEITRPGALLDGLLDEQLAKVVASTPAYQKATAQPGFLQLMGFVRLLESQLSTDWRTALRRAFGGGVAFAARPDGGTLLIVDSKDEKILAQLHESFVNLAKADGMRLGQKDRVSSKEYKGVTAWTVGPNEAHAIVGTRLVLANRPETLAAALDLRAAADAEGKRLSNHAGYKAAREAAGKGAAGKEAVAVAYVNLAMVKQNPDVAAGLARSRDPMASLLFAGVIEAIESSTWLGMGLHLEGDALTLRAMVDGKVTDPSGPASFASPREAGRGALPNLAVPRRLAALTLYRDLHGFYAAKDTLFPDRTSGLIFFENMMGIFFSGLDLTEEVFAETQPEIRLVVAEQAYDPAVGTPRVQLPAFALVMRLRHPKEFFEVMEEAWQKSLGLVNFTRGQKALPGLIIDKITHGDVKYSVAYFRAPKAGERKDIDVRFNFRPALALAGDHLILSSTDGLTADLIDALKKEAAAAPKPLSEANSLLEVDGPQVYSILQANRENMILQNMVEKGHSREQAESEMGMLLMALEYAGGMRISLESRDGAPRASWELKFRMPAEGGKVVGR